MIVVIIGKNFTSAHSISMRIAERECMIFFKASTTGLIFLSVSLPIYQFWSSSHAQHLLATDRGREGAEAVSEPTRGMESKSEKSNFICNFSHSYPIWFLIRFSLKAFVFMGEKTWTKLTYISFFPIHFIKHKFHTFYVLLRHTSTP